MINGNVKLYVKRGLNVRRGGQDNRGSSSGSCSEDKPIEQFDEKFKSNPIAQVVQYIELLEQHLHLPDFESSRLGGTVL